MLRRPLLTTGGIEVGLSANIEEMPPIGDVPLFLAEGNRSYDESPNRVQLGVVTLGGWQIHPIPAAAEQFSGSSAYLVKINYDLSLEAGAPAPEWLEIVFDLTLAGVAVLDALPRSVDQPELARSYRLTSLLSLVPANGMADDAFQPGLGIGLPALTPTIVATGIGSSRIGWRHKAGTGAGVPTGTHSGWFVLLAPSSCRSVPVAANCRYGIAPRRRSRLREGARPDSFTVRLPAADSGGSPSFARGIQAGSGGGRRGPRVFVSYAHDTDEHKNAVEKLCAALAEHDVAVQFDQWAPTQRQDWNKWMTAGIMRADYVLVLASPAYRQVSEGHLSGGPQRGVEAEYNVLLELLRRDPGVWVRKILPVVLPGRLIDEIPIQLQPRNADYYIIKAVSRAGVDHLVRVLRYVQ